MVLTRPARCFDIRPPTTWDYGVRASSYAAACAHPHIHRRRPPPAAGTRCLAATERKRQLILATINALVTADTADTAGDGVIGCAAQFADDRSPTPTTAVDVAAGCSPRAPQHICQYQ